VVVVNKSSGLYVWISWSEVVAQFVIVTLIVPRIFTVPAQTTPEPHSPSPTGVGGIRTPSRGKKSPTAVDF